MPAPELRQGKQDAADACDGKQGIENRPDLRACSSPSELSCD
jgi:hypothetical protein